MKSFVFWMLFASALGMVKIVALAQVLPAAGFGDYAMIVGTSGFATMAISLGLIEGTIKRFPRHWVDGQTKPMVEESWAIVRSTALRGFMITIVFCAMGFLAGGSRWSILALFVGILGTAGLFSRVLSALNLAIGQQSTIRNFSLFRSAASFFAAVLGGYLGGWQGAAIGEIMAVALNLAQGIFGLRTMLDLFSSDRRTSYAPPEADGTLYSSALLTSSTILSDRAVVNALAGSYVTGSYSFVMILGQIGQVFVNIVGQKVGPDIIRAVKEHGGMGKTLREMTIAGVIVCVVSLAATLVFLGAMNLAITSSIFAKFDIGTVDVVLSGIACIFYYYVILEYALIAYNRESDVFRASLASVISYSVSIGISHYFSLGVSGFISAFLAARMTQTIWLGWALKIQLRIAANREVGLSV